MKLRGDRCQCRTCGEYFNSTYAFDKHRTGKHGLDRRCLSVPEMRALGMAVNATGFWVSELNARQARGEARISGDLMPGVGEGRGQGVAA